MKSPVSLLAGGALLLLGMFRPLGADEVKQIKPYYKYSQTLVASAGAEDKDYLMAPIIQSVGPGEMLVAYKRGYAHMRDHEAEVEVLRFNPESEQVTGKSTLRHSGVNFQNVEFARFSDGTIACFVDTQQSGPEGRTVRAPSEDVSLDAGTVVDGVFRTRNHRLGLIEFRSRDGGRTWEDRGKLGPVDGVEYGYAFEAITENDTTWMLVMTFAGLEGSKSVDPQRPHAGPVDVIRTTDNGATWHRVASLHETLGGISINESSFVRLGDGFIISCRGYDNRQWLILADAGFKPRRIVDLTAAHPFIHAAVGRPRVFLRNGRAYLLGRNWDKPPHRRGSVLGHEQARERQPDTTPMKLSLFRFDPDTLAVNRHVLLDNAEEENVIDGYYAVPYWQERRGRTYFNVITYKRMVQRHPDILRLEFDWEELK